MKKIALLCLIFTMCLLSLFQQKVYAEEKTYFNGVEIVTDKTYQKVTTRLESSSSEDEEENFTDGIALATASSPYWKEESGVKSFYDANDNLVFNKDSKFVIDVSKWQGEIDWEKVKNSGVDGAIIRAGGSGMDSYFIRNVTECNRLGIPYGVYLYSYAYDVNYAYAEAEALHKILSQVDLDLSFPIYYDLEVFATWTDSNGVERSVPTTTSEYEKIVSTFINRMNELGYENKVDIYSYRSYLQTKLNSSKILPYVSWVAAYTQELGFTNDYYNGDMGWQYSSSGKVDGISGNVDVNCFSDYILLNRLNFTDVSSNKWYFDTVKQVNELGLMTGTDATHFSPSSSMTRGMVVTVLHRMAGYPKVAYSSIFPDVGSDAYYTNAVIWAASNKIVSGYNNGKFGPSDNITRQDVAVILYNYARKLEMDVTKKDNLSTFKDTSTVSSYAVTAMKWAVGNEILSGTADGKLNPKSQATRAECAKMLLQFYKLTNN